MVRAAVYCRISADRAGQGLGVARQEQLCRELAAGKSWEVAEVYVDNDISAYSGKARPAYERMLADIDAGARDAVLVVDTDRLSRTPAELERFIEQADRRGVALANVSGDLDLSTSDGRFRARIMGAVARQESEKKSERIRREREQAARAGKPHGGARPFGFEADRVTHRAEEAALIREAARRVLAGESLRAVAGDWQDRGVRSAAADRPVTVSRLHSILINPRVAGLRRHRVRDRHGTVTSDQTYPAVWAPIVDRDIFEQLTAKMRNGGAGKRGRPVTHLLTGMLSCGRCGARLRANYRSDGPERRRVRYVCVAAPGERGCGRLAVTAGPLEAEVTGQVLAALSGPGLAAALTSGDGGDGGLGEELAASECRLDLLAADYADGTIGRREWLAARERLTERIDALRRTLACTAGRSVLADLPAGDEALRAAWDAGTVDWRRALLAAVVERIDVAPHDPAKRRRFDPARVQIVWRV